MASPFKFFRKYTGAFMVFLTVMLMVAFGFGDLIGQGGGGGYGQSAGAKEVAVSWEGGELTNGDISRLIGERYVLRGFHDAVLQFGNQAAYADGTIDLQLRVQPMRLPASPQEGIERDVVNTKIFADAARDAGMAVSDETVKDYIRSLGRDKVTNDQLRYIVSQLARGQGRRLTVEYVFDLVREALLARNYNQSYAFTMATVLPQQRYRDWLAVNDRVVVEAAALPIDRYLSEVPEPTEVELEEFFEEHKERQPLPDFIGRVELPSPTPGFAIPRRVSLQYLRADYQAALDAADEEVTDEEIAAYYEENKSQFIKADDLLSGGDLLGDDLFAPADEDESGGDEDEGDDETEEASDEERDAEPEGESSLAPRDNPFRFVALQNEEEAEAASETADQEAEEPAAETEEAADDSDNEEPEVEYQPLDEVTDEIRKRLAEERAAKSLRELMDGIQSDLLDGYNAYFTEVVAGAPEGEEVPPPPASVSDLKPIAEKNNLELVTIEEIAGLELRDKDLGKTFDVSRSSSDQPLLALLFAEEESPVGDYEPLITVNYDSLDRFLVQRTADLPPTTPKLDDVREQVVAAWKKQEAAKLALAAAEKSAEEAEGAGSPLTDFFANDSDVDVVETDAFSRMSVGLINQQTRQVPLQISQPSGIVAAGPEFLTAVFDLEDDAVGAVLNHDESIAYVVRIVRHTDSEPELRKSFLSEGAAWFGQPAMDQARRAELGSAFISDMVGEEGLDWKRLPDQPDRG